MKLLVLIFCLNLNLVVIKGRFKPKCPANTFNGTSIKLCNEDKWCKITVANECIFGNNSEFRNTYVIDFVDKIKVIKKGALQNFESLRGIFMDSVGLIEIEPGSFINLTNFKFLQVINNEIKKVNFETFNGLNLIYLSLRRNRISTIDSNAFANQTPLIVDLGGNKLKTFDQKWFGDNSELQTLYLGNNLIESLKPYSFNKLKDLLAIFLMNNLITRIEENTFHGFKKIRYIHLSNNRLETIDVNAFENKIEELDLSINYLKYVPKDYFRQLDIERLILLPNPWICKCLDEIYAQLKDKRTRIINPDDTKLTWNNSYPICVVPLIKKSQFDSCNENFVNTVRNDKIFTNFFSVLNYETIATNLDFYISGINISEYSCD